MGTNYRSLKLLVPVLLVSAACSTGAEPRAAESTLPVASSTTADPSVANTPADAFPIAAFAEISEEPIADEMAAALQAALDDMADDSGMTATVMSADGTWSGAAGTADGVRDMQIEASAAEPDRRTSGGGDLNPRQSRAAAKHVAMSPAAYITGGKLRLGCDLPNGSF